MKKRWIGWLAAGAVALGLVSAAGAAGFLTNGMPQAGNSPYGFTIPFTGNEMIPLDTLLPAGQSPQSESASLLQLQGYFGGGVTGWRNALIGGDFTTNLFQRGTTSASITTAVLYGPDRWFGWSGLNTAFTIIRSTTASDLPTGFGAAVRVQRTAGQTGVLPVCVSQVVEGTNARQFAGKVAEFSFWENTGANFSPTNGNLNVYVTYGTGTDEGSVNLAFGLNGGGGGAAGWTGQTNALAAVAATSIPTGAVGTLQRWVGVANIPSTATEIAATICYTPVGTAGANDWVSLSGMQLAVNQALSQYAGTVQLATSVPASAFDRRPNEVETVLQQRYYYQLTESAAVTPVASCAAVDVTHTNCLVPFPVTMRTAPTMTYANGFASPTDTTQATLGACTTLASAATVAATVANTLGVLVNCTAATIPAAGVASFLYSNGGTGVIRASAEL